MRLTEQERAKEEAAAKHEQLKRRAHLLSLSDQQAGSLSNSDRYDRICYQREQEADRYLQAVRAKQARQPVTQQQPKVYSPQKKVVNGNFKPFQRNFDSFYDDGEPF